MLKKEENIKEEKTLMDIFKSIGDKTIDNIDLNKYIKELDDDMKITQSNILEKSLNTSTIRCKWNKYYNLEQSTLKKIKAARKLYLAKKLLENGKEMSPLKRKSEAQIRENDEIMLKLKKKEDLVQENIDFIQRALGVVNEFYWTVKNSIEIFKLGINT